MGFSNILFKGAKGQKFQIMLDFVPEGCFYLNKQCRPRYNAAICSISSGSSLFLKVLVYWYPVYKEFDWGRHCLHRFR